MCNLIWDSRTPPYLCFVLVVFMCMTYLYHQWVREERKKGEMLPSLLLASWFLRSCIFISAGLSVWVGRYESQSIFSLCSVRGKFRLVRCRGQPTSFAHAALWGSYTHQSGKTLSSAHRWSRCVNSWQHQVIAPLSPVPGTLSACSGSSSQNK